jgi:hypothetical protein
MNQDVILSGQDDEDWLQAYNNALEEKVDTDVTREDEFLWCKARLWVPDCMEPRNMIL